MKRKIIYSAMLLVLMSMIAIQSCKKEAPLTPKEYLAAMPASPEPAADAVIPFTGSGQAINLTWAGTATNAIQWDVFFGDSDAPDQVATGLTTNSYTAHVTAGGTYYWQVRTIDANNIESISPLWSFEVNSNPNVPVLTAPANNAVAVSITPTLTWTATDPEHDELTYDLYLGTAASPGPYATGLTSATFTATTALSQNTAYYWKVVAHDPYGGVSTSAIWKFTSGSLPVNSFIGSYNVAENSVQNGAYDYTMAFTKIDNTTIQADNWWDSGWAAKFTLDFAKNTIVMTPFTFVSGASTYIASGSGKITPATGVINLVYSVTRNGVLLENGTEVFTKAGKSYQVQTDKRPKL